MATQSSDMLHPAPTRTSPAQARPTAAMPTAHTLRALPGHEQARGLKLAAADTSEPDRRHEDDDNDEAAWLPSGDEAAAATDTVGSAGADTAGASSVTGGSSATGAAAEATAGASFAPAGSSLFASLTANPELTVGAILGTVTLGAAMTGKSPYDGSTEPAPAPLASGAGQQHGSAVDSPATGNRGSEETGRVTSAGSASNTASSSGTATSTGADAGAGSGSGAGAASGSHASSDASHVGAAGTESSSGNAGGSGAPDGAVGGAATSPGTGHGADPAHTQSLNYGTDENKAIGAAIFNGASPQDTPEFIRITSIRGKNAGTVNGLMTLENGAEITVGQVISRADFERIFWNASKSDGCFSFVPVKDAQGTAIPNTVEQTVIIRTPESTKPGSTVDTPATENGNTGHDTTSQTGSGAGTTTGSNAGTPSGTGSNSGTGAGSGTHAGTGTTGSGSGSDSNAVSGSGSDSPTGSETPSGSNPPVAPDTSTNPDSTSGASATTGSGSGTGAGSDTNPDANTANGPGKDDANSGEGQRSQDGVQPPSQSTGAQDKGGQTTPQGQDGSANNGQTPAQNQGDQSIGSEAPARNDDAQSSDGKTPAPTPGSQGSGSQTPAQNTSGQGDDSQTPPQNAGGGSDTGNPATGNPGTSDTAQTGGTQPDGTKGEDGEQGKNGEDTASPSNPPVTTPPPTPPDYTPNQSIQQAIHANNKPVGASIFNGTNPAHAPSFVKITAVLDKDGEEVPGAMTLGKDGEAITTNQVISKEQFDNVFLDALKAPGGSFKFVPVLDSEGTAMPGASEQTVSIGVDYLHHFPSQTFSKLFSEEAHLSHYKIFSIAENEDTNGTQDGMLKIDGNERTPLQKGDLIKPEDFDKLYWDYSSNNGGRFIFVGVDSTGRNINDSDGEQLVLEDLAKTRDGQEPPEIQIAGDSEDEGDEEAGISAHSATLHLESFAGSASAFHGPSHLSVNGQSTLDNLLEHQVSHGIL